MIIKEFFKTRTDGVDLYKTYSNEGFKIRQNETGNIFDEAIDISSASFSYSETDMLIENKEYDNAFKVL